ncbi:DegT/DnrJ/EryC1/StrS family aminotransferase [Bremerella cremea]|uniref:DegT/DnrJ/EryC1/StrS family aminotransferase n=1 Tax=Bremerella cremea TaxID=1031537 RepID=UPI0031E73C3F
MTTPQFRISELDYDQQELDAVVEVIKSQWLSQGPKIEQFENRFAEFVGSKRALAVSNGTAALHLALLASGIGPGDEVLVPSFTFVASVNAVLYVGAKPVFVDIVGPHDLNIDPVDMAAKITPRTKAAVVVHMAGFPADMDAILLLASEHNLVIVEDACHAVGARYNDNPASPLSQKMAGTAGTVGCFSFFANKNLVTGEGGMVVTDDPEIAERVRLARSHGMTKSSWDKAAGRATDYDLIDVGFNYRATELTAALGLIQLEKLPEGNRRRRECVARYRERLAGLPGISIPFADRLDDSSHHVFPILLEDSEIRAEFRSRLGQRGVQTTFHYPPVHLFTHYQKACPDTPPLPQTCDAANREVTLPLHARMTVEMVDAICDVICEELGALTPSQVNHS